MALDASTISEVIAAVSAIAATGGIGGLVHTKKKSTRLAERVAALEEHKKGVNRFMTEIKEDLKEIKKFLMERN